MWQFNFNNSGGQRFSMKTLLPYNSVKQRKTLFVPRIQDIYFLRDHLASFWLPLISGKIGRRRTIWNSAIVRQIWSNETYLKSGTGRVITAVYCGGHENKFCGDKWWQINICRLQLSFIVLYHIVLKRNMSVSVWNSNFLTGPKTT